MRRRLRYLTMGALALTLLVSCQMLAGLEDRSASTGSALGGQAGAAGARGAEEGAAAAAGGLTRGSGGARGSLPATDGGSAGTDDASRKTAGATSVRPQRTGGAVSSGGGAAGDGASAVGGISEGGATGGGGAAGDGASAAGGIPGGDGSAGGTSPAGGTTTGADGSGGSQAAGGASSSAAGDTAAGGATVSGGAAQGGGVARAGGTGPSGGTAGTGGLGGGSGGAGTGGDTGTAGATTGGASSGGSATGGTTGSGGGATGGSTGTCTPSEDTGRSVSGSGPHPVVIETNPDPGIKCGTIYRPADLGGAEKYPIFVWGEGGCSQDSLVQEAAMGEIASWGYFIIADGTPGAADACAGGQDGAALLDYITWAIAENGKSCSAYYQSLDTTEIAADGFSCGGLMAEQVSGDPRFTAIGITSSGLFAEDQTLYQAIHTPFKILLGGPDDMAYTNGLRDYDNISALGVPILLLSKDNAGHGGDLGNAKGDFNTINLAWLNWQLKGDEGPTGKALLIGPSCEYCDASGWEFQSANIE